MITDIEKSDNKILEIKLILWYQKVTELYFHFVLLLMASNIDAMIVWSKQRTSIEGRHMSA